MAGEWSVAGARGQTSVLTLVCPLGTYVMLLSAWVATVGCPRLPSDNRPRLPPSPAPSCTHHRQHQPCLQHQPITPATNRCLICHDK